MNEIKKCSIAGVSFTLETAAYEALSGYLKSLHDTYKDDPDGDEIIADIEARIAELILSAQPAEGIVGKPLIDNIIKQLGSAAEIDEDGPERHAETIDQNGNPRIPRRLYRDLQNGKLGGVCAGVANYFDIDPTWIRLGMFLPLVFTPIAGSLNIFEWLMPFSSNLFGLLVLGYFVMWFSVPVASSARQKLEMKGERITANSIRENTSMAADERERSIIANLVAAVGRFLLICVKILTLLILIGLVCGVSALGVVAITTTPVMMGTDFATGLALGTFFVVAIVPLIVLIYLAVMLLISRRPNGKVMLVMFLIWLASLACMTVSIIKSPVNFDRQLENTFESVFENDNEVLFEEFTEEEINEFRESLGEDYSSTNQYGDFTITLEGENSKVSQIESTVEVDNETLSITDGEGKRIVISPSGLTIDGKEFVNYTTETVGSTGAKSVIFRVGDVKVRLSKGLADAAEQIHDEAVKEWNEALDEYKESVKDAKQEIDAAAKEIRQQAKSAGDAK